MSKASNSSYTSLCILTCLPVLTMLLAPVRLGGQELLAAFDSSVVETGNSLRLVLSVPARYGKPALTDFSAWSDAFPPENILDRGLWQRTGDYWQCDVVLIAFDADTLLLPPLRVSLPGGQTLESASLDLIVQATDSPDDLVDMADIKDIQREPARWTDFLPFLAALSGLLLLAVLLYLFLRWKKKRRESSPVQTRESARDRALRKLEQIESEKRWQRGEIASYYEALSYILREYFEACYAFPALEESNVDILKKLAQRGFPENTLSQLAGFLEYADLAKFARVVPPESYHTEAADFVRKCIRN